MCLYNVVFIIHNYLIVEKIHLNTYIEVIHVLFFQYNFQINYSKNETFFIFEISYYLEGRLENEYSKILERI